MTWICSSAQASRTARGGPPKNAAETITFVSRTTSLRGADLSDRPLDILRRNACCLGRLLDLVQESLEFFHVGRLKGLKDDDVSVPDHDKLVPGLEAEAGPDFFRDNDLSARRELRR